jgi:DNA-binding response OmpR family regulator
MIDLIRLILNRNGFKLIGAMGGREGLRTVRRVRPDLVLLNLMMPEVDGWEVHRQMKADAELRNIPIIVVTVMEQSSDKVRDLQVHDYVRKPFIPQELVQRVSNVLDLVV